MIEIKNITKTFDGRKVVKDVSFKFEQGKTNLIIGESGCGKTTILKLMVGLHQIDSGSVFFNNKDFPKLSPLEQQEIRQKIGMLFQGGALFDSLNVEQNVQFPLDMFTNLSEAEKKERVNFCLERVKLTNKNHLFPAELSGGMKKRAALARAISNKPEYLFCDEPNSGLDPKTSIIIDTLIKEITEDFNITTVIVTHDMNSVIEIGEKIMFIHEGENYWSGTKQEILKANNKELKDFVFASEFMKMAIHGN
ncbi:MAG: ATP-binding cassette domain-containing protein [Bacteroidetes bacterium]|nr:ATP-binding cassette domain-containing protein [Bacteroidota bacterium]